MTHRVMDRKDGMRQEGYMDELEHKAEQVTEEMDGAAEAAAEQVEETIQAIEQPLTGEVVEPGIGKGPSLVDQMAGAVKEFVGEVEKQPLTGKVVKAVKEVREDIESGEVQRRVQKAVQETAGQVERVPLVQLLHKALLAGVGAVALAQDEVEDLVNRLVERGEIAEADGKRMLKDVVEQRRDTVEQVQRKASEYIDHPTRAVDDVEKRIHTVMAKMNIPTKDEIEVLNAKISALTRKLEELKKERDENA